VGAGLITIGASVGGMGASDRVVGGTTVGAIDTGTDDVGVDVGETVGG